MIDLALPPAVELDPVPKRAVREPEQQPEQRLTEQDVRRGLTIAGDLEAAIRSGDRAAVTRLRADLHSLVRGGSAPVDGYPPEG